MTSSRESSKFDPTRSSVKHVESLAGLFHPHAIEVQDFTYYALILDVRSAAEFDDDHIPGAVRLKTAGLPIAIGDGASVGAGMAMDAAANGPLPADLAELVAPIKLDQAILVYCGREGRDSLAVARALRWRGWTADVVPGGWINYRRWVQAGLEALPRLIAFRVVTASLGGEMARLLAGLSIAGEQVLDVAAIAGWHARAFTPTTAVQPTQTGFESRLLWALRQIDPRRPVWVADADRHVGRVALPPALMDAFAIAPTVALACPFAERLSRCREDEPLLNGSVQDILQVAAASSPSMVPRAFDAEIGQSDIESLLARLLSVRDEQWRCRSSATAGVRANLPALVTPSLAPDRLLEAIERWLLLVRPQESG